MCAQARKWQCGERPGLRLTSQAVELAVQLHSLQRDWGCWWCSWRGQELEKGEMQRLDLGKLSEHKGPCAEHQRKSSGRRHQLAQPRCRDSSVLYPSWGTWLGSCAPEAPASGCEEGPLPCSALGTHSS